MKVTRNVGLGVGVVVAAAAIIFSRALLLPASPPLDNSPSSSAAPSSSPSGSTQESPTPTPSPSCLTGGKLVDGSCVYPIPDGKPTTISTKKTKAKTGANEKYVPFTLVAGDCFDSVSKPHETRIEAVDCGVAHTAQLLSLGPAWSHATYYDVVDFKNSAKAQCASLESIVDVSWDWLNDPDVQIGLIYPSPASYNKGENLAGCYLYNSAAAFTGSFLEPKPTPAG